MTNGGVLEGIGEEILGSDPAQPLDILALQETTSNGTTVQPIVNGLDIFYSTRGISAGYAMSPVQGTQFGGNTFGNGPNALVYNTNTLQLIASVGVGTPHGASNGEYGQVMRHEFAPAGVTPTTTNEFYVSVSHYKCGTNSTDLTARQGEAVIIRNNEATTLPATARVLYVGDYNIAASSEASYMTILSNYRPQLPRQRRRHQRPRSLLPRALAALIGARATATTSPKSPNLLDFLAMLWSSCRLEKRIGWRPDAFVQWRSSMVAGHNDVQECIARVAP